MMRYEVDWYSPTQDGVIEFRGFETNRKGALQFARRKSKAMGLMTPEHDTSVYVVCYSEGAGIGHVLYGNGVRDEVEGTFL